MKKEELNMNRKHNTVRKILYTTSRYAGFGIDISDTYYLEVDGTITKKTCRYDVWSCQNEKPVTISTEDFIKMIQDKQYDIMTDATTKIEELNNVIKTVSETKEV